MLCKPYEKNERSIQPRRVWSVKTQPSLLRLDFSLNSDVTDRAAITVSNGESRQRNFFQLSGFCMTKDHPVVGTMCFHRLKAW